jgi:hypothetical protein
MQCVCVTILLLAQGIPLISIFYVIDTFFQYRVGGTFCAGLDQDPVVTAG